MTEILPAQAVDPARFRRALALHAAGVVIVTARSGGAPPASRPRPSPRSASIRPSSRSMPTTPPRPGRPSAPPTASR
ncbi:hypothetical protein [Actinomadura madurae]|uniref:hypothetical protein n=1 Tax=Actinomadura madurae TaxID=1993 RepID=UPI0035562D8E